MLVPVLHLYVKYGKQIYNDSVLLSITKCLTRIKMLSIFNIDINQIMYANDCVENANHKAL